jgi:hypothetical protein
VSERECPRRKQNWEATSVPEVEAKLSLLPFAVTDPKVFDDIGIVVF